MGALARLGYYAKSWKNLRDATSRHVPRGRVTHLPDDTRHDIRVRARGRRFRPRTSIARIAARTVVALSLAAGLWFVSWRLGSRAHLPLGHLGPFLLLAAFVHWWDNVRRGWRIVGCALLLLALIPLLG